MRIRSILFVAGVTLGTASLLAWAQTEDLFSDALADQLDRHDPERVVVQAADAAARGDAALKVAYAGLINESFESADQAFSEAAEYYRVAGIRFRDASNSGAFDNTDLEELELSPLFLEYPHDRDAEEGIDGGILLSRDRDVSTQRWYVTKVSTRSDALTILAETCSNLFLSVDGFLNGQGDVSRLGIMITQSHMVVEATGLFFGISGSPYSEFDFYPQ